MTTEFFPSVHLTPEHLSRNAQMLEEKPLGPLLGHVGELPVLITCVHGFNHLRDGATKGADSGTLALSHLLALVSGASWMAVGQPEEPDSNHHKGTFFKQALAEAVKHRPPQLVIDIHGSHAARPFDVDIGSLHGKSWGKSFGWQHMLQSLLRNSGFLTTTNAVFAGLGSTPDAQTVVAFFSQELHVPAVQLEISSALCDVSSSRQALHQHAKLVNALADFVKRVGTQRMR